MNELNEIAKEYIERYELDLTVEELFEEFEHIYQASIDFEEYLKTSGIIYKLNKMKRNARLKEKRSIFCKWYFTKNQNDRSKKYRSLLIELSEMIFVSERTVQFDVFGETTAQSEKNASQ